MPNDFFQFKRFRIEQDRTTLKVGTDGVLLGAWTDYSGARRILDIGTGTGLLALIAAQRNDQAMIDAIEIDDASAQQAVENIASSPWADRVRVHRMDVRRMSAGETYDLIICNPPFYGGEMGSPDERTGVAKHGDELRFEDLIAVSDRALSERGRLSIIVPLNRQHALRGEAERVDLHIARRCEVRYRAGRPPKRVLLELRRGEQTLADDAITVEENGPFDYSERYRGLLSDLMLKF